jgi:hypothetical protein
VRVALVASLLPLLRGLDFHPDADEFSGAPRSECGDRGNVTRNAGAISTGAAARGAALRSSEVAAEPEAPAIED